ncbi:MAG: PspC domain-containing protein [Candidatus Eisenbacteria sp.]|nr:PspC domain-containing protein [Candidatus Eisenbacteria bacterium]
MTTTDAGSNSGARVVQVGRLYKARDGIFIDGVCAGLAEYMGVSAMAVRAAIVILAFAGFWGLVLYLLGMVLIPRSPVAGVSEETAVEKPAGRGWAAGLGLGIIVLGVVLLLSGIGLLQVRFWRVWHIGFGVSWPLLVVVLGWVIMVRHEAATDRRGDSSGRLERCRDDRMVAGLCGGIARRMRLDPSLVRVLWSFFTLLSGGVGAVLYGMLVLGISEEAQDTPAEAAGNGAEAPEKVDPL